MIEKIPTHLGLQARAPARMTYLKTHPGLDEVVPFVESKGLLLHAT